MKLSELHESGGEGNSKKGFRPPVGTECLYDYTRSRSNCSGTCVILGYDNNQVWFKPYNAKHVTMSVFDVNFTNYKMEV